MRKWLSVILCITILIALVGCFKEPGNNSTPVNTDSIPTGNQNAGSQPSGSQTDAKDYCVPTVDPDFWELLCENCDMTMYFDGTREGHLLFWLVAAHDPAGKTMTITTDAGHTSEVKVYRDGDPKIMDFSFFMMYQDFDWESLKTDIETQGEILKPWEAKYAEALGEIPVMYYYRFPIPLKDLGIDETATEPQQLKSLTVTLDGQTKTYDLGKVHFLPGKVPGNYSSEGGLNCSSAMRSGYGSGISKDGRLKVDRLKFTAMKDVVLQGFSFPGSEGVTVVSCNLVITTPFGDKFNMTWDANSPIEVDEGSEIQVELMTVDPFRADKLIANTIRYISLDYTRDGEAYGEYIYMSCAISVDPYIFYEWRVGDVDVWKYLYEYKDMMYRDNSETT